jgi:hypothetical protein
MGHNRTFRCISDATTHGSNVALICRCRYMRVFTADELRALLSAKGINDALEVCTMRLRCTRCGDRRPTIRMTAARSTATGEGPPEPFRDFVQRKQQEAATRGGGA